MSGVVETLEVTGMNKSTARVIRTRTRIHKIATELCLVARMTAHRTELCFAMSKLAFRTIFAKAAILCKRAANLGLV